MEGEGEEDSFIEKASEGKGDNETLSPQDAILKGL